MHLVIAGSGNFYFDIGPYKKNHGKAPVDGETAKNQYIIAELKKYCKVMVLNLSSGGYMSHFTREFLDMMGELTILPVGKNR